MTPLARVRVADRAAAPAGERRGRRYEEDRAAAAAMLKNYSLLSLLWILPLAIALSIVRFVFLLLGRRFEEAFELAAAWGWNVANLPGTLARCDGSWSPRASGSHAGSRPRSGSSRSSERSTRRTKESRSGDGCATGRRRSSAPIP
jgi:hypothetical protein